MADELVVDFEKRFPSGAIVAASFDVSLPGGSVFGIFGPSGAGKTTVVRAIAGLERPGRGTVRFDGETWFDDRTWVEPQQRRVGYVGQAPALFPHLTVSENIEYWRHAGNGRRAAASTADLLAMLEIEGLASRRPRELSGGQAQRVALARALAPGPRLLLLDEPFSGLDLPVRVRLRGHLRTLVERLQIAVILVTHDRTDAIALCREMAVLAGGRVRQVGPVAEVFRRPADLVVAESVGIESVVPARVERVDAGLVDLSVGDARVRAAEGGPMAEGAEAFVCIRAEDVTLERAASASASARNHLPGRVVRVDAEGHVERVTLDCGFPLVALVTRNAREEMGLEPGSPVVAAIKATNIHLVERE
jgi:molybdenum ABC transporter ATP-binding protein